MYGDVLHLWLDSSNSYQQKEWQEWRTKTNNPAVPTNHVMYKQIDCRLVIHILYPLEINALLLYIVAITIRYYKLFLLFILSFICGCAAHSPGVWRWLSTLPWNGNEKIWNIKHNRRALYGNKEANMQKSRRFVPIQMTRRRSTEDEYVLFSFNRIIYTNTSCFDEMNFSEREKRFIIITFPETRGSPSSIWSDTTRKTSTTFSVVTSRSTRCVFEDVTLRRTGTMRPSNTQQVDTIPAHKTSILVSLLMMMMMMKVREGSRASADVDEMTDKELSLPVPFGYRRQT